MPTPSDLAIILGSAFSVAGIFTLVALVVMMVRKRR